MENTFEHNFFHCFKGMKYIGPDFREYDLQQSLGNVFKYEKMQAYSGIRPRQGYKSPLRLQLEITNRCNLQCKFCYNHSGPSNEHELEASELERILDEIIELEVLEIVLTGGEIFLKPDKLFFVLDRLQRGNISMHMVTNGWFITEEIADRLKSYNIMSIQISIDGFNEKVHDGQRGVAGSWRRALNSLRILSDRDFYTAVACVMMKENWRQMSTFLDLCFYLGAQQVILGDILLDGRGKIDGNQLKLSDDEYEKIIQTLTMKHRDYLGLMDVTIGGDINYSVIIQLLRQPVGCVIRANGDVIPSCGMQIPLGNVKTKPLKDIWADEFLPQQLLANSKIIDFLESIRLKTTNKYSLIRTW
ncbi:MAG: radical SAM/SPASM domain-containing protein [bacterium]